MKPIETIHSWKMIKGIDSPARWARSECWYNFISSVALVAKLQRKLLHQGTQLGIGLAGVYSCLDRIGYLLNLPYCLGIDLFTLQGNQAAYLSSHHGSA